MVVFTSQWCRLKLIIQEKAKLSSSPSAETLVFFFLASCWNCSILGPSTCLDGDKNIQRHFEQQEEKHLAGRVAVSLVTSSHFWEKWSEPKEEIRSFYHDGWSSLALQGRILLLGDVGKESSAAEQLRRWRRLPRQSGSMFDWHRKLLSSLGVSAKWTYICAAEAGRKAEVFDTTTVSPSSKI